MRKVIKEQTTLVLSITKWVVLSLICGVVVGGAVSLFLKALFLSSNFLSSYRYYFLLLPFGLLTSKLLTKYIAAEAEGQGTEKVIEAIHRNNGKINIKVAPVKLLSTIFTIATGGSAGKEAPAAQIGSSIMSFLSDIFKLDDNERKKLVICGISAGFSSVFGTPIAGAIFGVEVLYVGNILYEVLLPSFISGIVAHYICSLLGIKYFKYIISCEYQFSLKFLLELIATGIFFGIVARTFIEVFNRTEKFKNKLKISEFLQPILCGIILIFLTFVFSQMYLGLGTDIIEKLIKGEEVPFYAFLLKIIFTSLTLNFGGSGGEITPMFFIGATAGSLLSKILGYDISFFSALGLTGILAGCTNTPIASSIMAVELFGSQIAPFASIVCVVSFIMTGQKSIYPTQVFVIKKSRLV